MSKQRKKQEQKHDKPIKKDESQSSNTLSDEGTATTTNQEIINTKEKLTFSEKKSKDHSDKIEEEEEEVEDDDDDDEKIDQDELNDILHQFDRASESHAKEEADESSLIPLTDEKVPEDEDELIMHLDPKSELYSPPNVHFFIHLRKRFLKMQILLHKIPEKYMSVDLQEDYFTVDTTGYTRKLFLQRKYPGLIKVEANKYRSELNKGDVLTIWVPIASMPKQTYDRELKILQGRLKEKSIKFKPEVKKIIVERAKKAAKKSAQKKRKREREKFYEQGLDIKQKKKKRTENK